MRFAIIDIETRVDKRLVREVFFPAAESPEHAYLQMSEQLGGGFFPITLHVPIVIGWGEVNSDHGLESVQTLTAGAGGEEALIAEFWRRAEQFRGCLVTFNGRRFDLPVLELHALRWGLSAPAHFARRLSDEHHFDLMDFASGQGAIALRGGLDLLLKSIGLPGKGAVSGPRVQELFDAGRLPEIESYCRDDVIQTFFLFLRVELLRGRLEHADYRRAWERSARFLEQIGAPSGIGDPS